MGGYGRPPGCCATSTRLTRLAKAPAYKVRELVALPFDRRGVDLEESRGVSGREVALLTAPQASDSLCEPMATMGLPLAPGTALHG
eukprot:10703261-Heterocapsa_arctica.AAC.1